MFPGKNDISDISLKEIFYKEIEQVQACIKRMSDNSFSVKKWSVGLITVLIALLKDVSISALVVVMFFIIVVVFWYLDAFFLRTERLYRYKYNWIVEKRLQGSTEYLLNLTPGPKGIEGMILENDKEEAEQFVVRVMFSKTLWPFYLTLILACVIFFVIKCYSSLCA